MALGRVKIKKKKKKKVLSPKTTDNSGSNNLKKTFLYLYFFFYIFKNSPFTPKFLTDLESTSYSILTHIVTRKQVLCQPVF